MKRKAEILSAVILCCALLSGCFGGKEVNERAFVQLMGIESDGEVYTVNIQLYKGESSSGDPDISKSNSEAVSGSGATLPEALAEAELKAGKSLYMGHVKLIIIGRGISSPASELSPLADAGSSAGVISPSCPIVCCSDPESITSLKMEDGLYSADRLMQIMKTCVNSGKCVYTSYASLAESTELNGAASPLPIVEVSDESAVFGGMIFASRDGIRGGLPDEDIAGLIILNGDFPHNGRLTVSAAVGEKTASAAVVGAKTRRYADISDGSLRVNAEVTLKLDITSDPGSLSEEEIAEAVCGNIRDSCISAYSAAVWYGGCDVFGIYKLIRRDCPQLLDEDRETVLRDSMLNINVKASVI